MTTTERDVYELATGRRTTFAEIERQGRQLVRALKHRGVTPHGVVGVLLDNCAEYFVLLRAYVGGLSLVPVNSALTEAEIRYILEDSGAEAVVLSAAANAEHADWLSEVAKVKLVVGSNDEDDFAAALAAESDAEDLEPAEIGTVLRYSSGTTGRPKAIVMREAPTAQGASRDFAGAAALLLGMDASTVLLLTAPLFHAGPMLLAAAAEAVGGSIVLASRFDAEEALAAIDQHRVTHSYWVPTMFNRLLRVDDARTRYDLSSHKAAVHVGAPCPRPIKERMFDWWGPIIHELYGGSEGVGMTYASPHDWLAHPGTVGRPIGCDVHICDEEGRELPAGETGVVYFDTGAVPFEYKGAPEKMREAIHASHPTWITLGDVGYVDADGCLYLTDRRSDIIITGGVNVYTREVETALSGHDAVQDVVVIGVPDPEFGERVTALVEVAPGVGDQELADSLNSFALTTLARFKRPRSIAFTHEMPRQPTGKARKQDIVAEVERALAAGRGFEPASGGAA